MSQTTVSLKVKMSCCGCSGAVKRVLDQTEGVESYDINMDQQKVTVISNMQADAVLQAVSKSGKKAELWVESPAADSETKPAEAEIKTTDQVVQVETKTTDEVVQVDETKKAEAIDAL